jgi:hypothetical protein
MRFFFATTLLFAMSTCADEHKHDEMTLATTHEVIEYCEESCTATMVDDTLTSAHLAELYTQVR